VNLSDFSKKVGTLLKFMKDLNWIWFPKFISGDALGIGSLANEQSCSPHSNPSPCKV
jgi:hypothetical protein